MPCKDKGKYDMLEKKNGNLQLELHEHFNPYIIFQL